MNEAEERDQSAKNHKHRQEVYFVISRHVWIASETTIVEDSLFESKIKNLRAQWDGYPIQNHDFGCPGMLLRSGKHPVACDLRGDVSRGFRSNPMLLDAFMTSGSY